MSLRRSMSAALALASFVFAAGWIVGADSRVMRQNFVGASQRCYVDQIEHFPTETNTIFLGTSRVRRGIDMEVMPGEVIVIFGPSGSGKSTFIRTINHLEKHA